VLRRYLDAATLQRMVTSERMNEWRLGSRTISLQLLLITRERVHVLSRQPGLVRCTKHIAAISIVGLVYGVLLFAFVDSGHVAAQEPYVSVEVDVSTSDLTSEGHFTRREIDEGYAELSGTMEIGVRSNWYWGLSVIVERISWPNGAREPDASFLQLRSRSKTQEAWSDWSSWAVPTEWKAVGDGNATIEVKYRVDLRGRPDLEAPDPVIRGQYRFRVRFEPFLRSPDQ